MVIGVGRRCLECGERFYPGRRGDWVCERCDREQMDELLVAISARLNAKPAAAGEEGERGTEEADGQ
jgi:hypothetical protein